MDHVKSERSSSDYAKIRHESSKPVKDRVKLIKTSKGNTRVPRRYHLKFGKLKELWSEYKATGEFPNPYRRSGVYYAFIQSLINLGVNEEHSFTEVKKEMERIMSDRKNNKGQTFWEAFLGKKPKNSLCEGAKDINGKIIQNATVLQRISGHHPYGEKLRQLRCSVDILPGVHKSLPNFKLNTEHKHYILVQSEKRFS